MKHPVKGFLAALAGLMLLSAHARAGALEELGALSASSPEEYGKVFDNNPASAESAAVRPMSQQQLKRLMIEDLDSIRNLLSVRYAPAGWKRAHFGWNPDAEIQKAKDRITSADSFGVKDYQKLLKTMLNSTRDYHVGIYFYSTEMASLPFTVTEAGGRYFISGINRNALPENTFPFEMGDELTAFDGKPVGKVIEDLKKRAGMDNAPQTDLAKAAIALTFRDGYTADPVPRGPVSISVKPAGAAKSVPFQLAWDYSPELIAPQPFVNKSGLRRELPMSWLGTMVMETPSAPGGAETSYEPGDKNGFLPDFGEKLWETPAENSFRAYIYRSPASGKDIGYIRIPTYTVNDTGPLIKDFAAIIAELELNTDALVIDQTNNPGGKLLYLYALASMLTDAPLDLPRHNITLTQADISEAVGFIQSSSRIKTDEDAKKFMGPDLGGYPVTYGVFREHAGFYSAAIKQWGAGKTLTDPLPMFGIASIRPNADVRYTKPIMILTNPLDLSGGDFFPAVMQDNKRAVIFGERTAGAGGIVKAYPRESNLLGVETIRLTATIARRANGLPLENLGVTPDIPYAVTPADVQGGYKDYIKAADAAINSLIK